MEEKKNRIYQKKEWLKIINDEKYQRYRDIISNTFKDLVFDEGPHKYYLGDRELTCVSNITHLFQEHFDEERIAQETYERNFENPDSKYYHMTPQEIKESWHKISNEACTVGSERHNFGESVLHFMINDFDGIVPEFKDRLHKDEDGDYYMEAKFPKEIAVINFWKDIPICIVPILAENKVYIVKDEYAYSGTFDILFFYDATLDGKDDKKSGLCVYDYKGLPMDTPILTTLGWKTMEELKENDIVFDKNGKETKIIHKSETHYNQCFKITLDNCQEIICDKDHRWNISFFRNKWREDKVMTTFELKEYLEGINRRNLSLIPRIKISNPILKENNETLLIDPYVLGVWLGDGHKSCGAITNMYDEIFEEIEKRGFKIGDDISQGGTGKAKTRTIIGLRHLLQHYNLLYNKHIPYQYLFSNMDIKKDILSGIMDTDGYYNKKRKRFVVATTQKTRVNFMRNLLGSMGIKHSIIRRNKYCNGKTFNGYDICFTCNFNPFKIRKLEISYPSTFTRSNMYTINKIEEVPMVPTQCIEVDSPSHTYCFGNSMIVTHNTNKDLYKNFGEKKLLPPFNDLLDMSLNVYKLQLSAYQNCLENIGLNIIARRLIWLKPDGSYVKIPLENFSEKLDKALKKIGPH